MKKTVQTLLLISILGSCKSKVESVSPTIEAITESVYASGTIESENQYQVFATANGVIDEVFVSEGDRVKANSVLFTIYNETSRINRENAELNAQFSDVNSNTSKISDLKLAVELAKHKMENDSVMYVRQKTLFNKNVISESQYEQSQLAYQNSKASYLSAQLKLVDLKKQLNLSDKQTKNNVRLTRGMESDYVVKSDIKGEVFSLLKKKGEMVNVQTPVAVIGNSEHYKIILQVDEYDIIKIQTGQKIIVTLDSYKGKSFEAKVTKINPLMNQKSKSFTIEAVFTAPPPVLYPNLSLEANILIRKKENAMTIPRKFVVNDHYVVLKDGKKKRIKTGLKDYQKIEVLSGLNKKDIIIVPDK